MNAMETAMRIYNGKPMVNSVNGKKEVMEQVFPLVKNTAVRLLHFALMRMEYLIPQRAELKLPKRYMPLRQLTELKLKI